MHALLTSCGPLCNLISSIPRLLLAPVKQHFLQQEAQAVMQAKDAELAVLHAELASLKKATPQADKAAEAKPRGGSAAAAHRYGQMGPGYATIL